METAKTSGLIFVWFDSLFWLGKGAKVIKVETRLKSL